jgi:hypothetical protein
MGDTIDGETRMKVITEERETGIKIQISPRDYTFIYPRSQPNDRILWAFSTGMYYVVLPLCCLLEFDVVIKLCLTCKQ